MKNKKYISALLLLTFSLFSLVYMSCKEHHDFSNLGIIGNCNDGIKNQNEEGIDCGGICPACANCTDGVKDGSEIGVDCGGTSCASCSPPSTPDNCSTLSNQSAITMGGTSFASVYGAHQNTSNASNIHIDLVTNANSISSYDIYLGANTFATLAVGAQQVFTTVDPNVVSTLQNGQASVTITQTGFSYNAFYGKAGEFIYFKRVSSTTMQVWFCGMYTTDVPSNGYYFSVSATF